MSGMVLRRQCPLQLVLGALWPAPRGPLLRCQKKRTLQTASFPGSSPCWQRTSPGSCAPRQPARRHSSLPPAEVPADAPDRIPDLRLFPPNKIRNFSIVAHVDHGKSTLADRLLEMAGNIRAGTHDHQVLDRLEVERERGITVKAQTATLFYTLDGEEYLLNLIDTPGHVDFSYEVQRSLTASQGVVLLVDANQGVQAQTLATFYAAFEADLAIIPVLNKIDLKTADPDAVTVQMNKALDIRPEDVLRVSAKTGVGVPDLFRAIIQRVPPRLCIGRPRGSAAEPFRAILFDSSYDRYRGVIALVAVQSGQLEKGDQVTFLSSDKVYDIKDVGILRPERVSTPFLMAGQVGYITCNMKTTKEAQIGDTLFGKERPTQQGIRIPKAKPMVPSRPFAADVVAAYIRQRQYPTWTSFFLSRWTVRNSHFGQSHFNLGVDGRNYHVLRTGCFPFLKYHCTRRPHQDLSAENAVMRVLKLVFAGIFPEDQSDNEALRDALDRLVLNDSSVSLALETNAALGAGWRLGFLGLLHMEVFLQRLEYEHGKCCIATIPSVPYQARLKPTDKLVKEHVAPVTIVSPEQLPPVGSVEEFREPWVIATIITPAKFIGDVLAMCLDRRGQQKNVTFLDNTRAMMQFYMPLSEVIVDFFDELKSKTSGYASFDYEDADYRPVNLIKVDFLLNGQDVAELSMLLPAERARYTARRVCERLKENVPQQQFSVMIQAAIGGKIIAREDMKALRKDVVGLKIYSHGGRDKGRKMKLLKRQKEGKERMRMVGNIEIPRDCFIRVLRKT